MKRFSWFEFLSKEWLLLISALGVIITSVYLQRIPHYSVSDFEIFYALFVFFVIVKGMKDSGILTRFSENISKGKFLPLKLILATFVLSMFVTNDVALIIIVPLTLNLTVEKKHILVILEAIAANSGAALTPFGNPQNLFIYWFYGVGTKDFIFRIAPFSLIFLVLLVLASFMIKDHNHHVREKKEKLRSSSYIYLILLLVFILAVIHILPLYIGMVIIAWVLLMDRKSFLIDYGLLITFFFFFGLSDNLRVMLGSDLQNKGHVFLLSALTSQIISNVPATLFFAKFTPQWKSLLWGVNVGGFGSLVGSLANFIAYKIYITNKDTDNSFHFTLLFLLFGYVAFFIGIGLYFVFERLL
ncbi:MAG: hypothetical protein GXO93_02320 [FCB group bacterium]|nr:hypothetical protein [FCB group bacterium]